VNEKQIEKPAMSDSRWSGQSIGTLLDYFAAPSTREHASSNLNANIPKNMPVDCAAAFASPVVGSFRAGGPIVLNFFEDRRSTRIVRYYRKRRRHRNRLETAARMKT
jgi:hypothetical protein